MKVMGSAMMIFEAIVIALAVPVAVIQGHYSHTRVWAVASVLVTLCILAVGGIRRDRRTALATGWIVQILVIVAGIAIHPFLVPAVLFLLVWILAVKLSEKTDVARTVD
jgi:cytochrome bd-type quinol oxidase subunit 2